MALFLLLIILNQMINLIFIVFDKISDQFWNVCVLKLCIMSSSDKRYLNLIFRLILKMTIGCQSQIIIE